MYAYAPDGTKIVSTKELVPGTCDVNDDSYSIVDGRLDFDHGGLECAIRNVAPAWTYVSFSNAEMPIALRLVTETGAVIVTETGNALIALV